MSATLTPPAPGSTPAPPPLEPLRRNRRRVRPGTVVLWIITILGFLYLYIPLITIVVFSFNDPKGKFNTSWDGFTLDNWLHPFSREDFTNALEKSLQIALISCTLATALGALIALALARYRIRGGAVLNLLLILPLTTPEIIMGASLFTLFFNQDANFGFWTIVIAHTMFCLSFVALTMKARLRGMDWQLEDAAMDLGSPPFRTFRKITLPLIVPGIIAAFLLSMALSIDDYIITSFVAGPVSTFPREIFDSAKVEIPAQVHVLASMIMFVAIFILLGATLVGTKRRRDNG